MGTLTELATFTEESSSGFNCPAHCPNSKVRGKSKIWEKGMTFSTSGEAEEHVKNEKLWSRINKNKTNDGEKVIFRCNETPLKSENPCQSSIYLLYHAESSKVTLYRSDDDHNHADSTKKAGLSTEVRNIVSQLYEDGTRAPISILSALERRGIEKPPKSQINNYLNRLRREKYGPSSINMNDLKKWCDDRSSIPEDMEKPFVVSQFNFDQDHEDFKIFITAKRLLENCHLTKLLQADATYKLNWQGYPVLLVGASDKSRIFHPYGVALTYGESTDDFEFIFRSLKKVVEQTTNKPYIPKILLADASMAITNGFVNVFGAPEVRLMCYFHVVKNVDTRLRSLDKETKKSFKSDLHRLQLSSSDLMFDKAVALFFEKWSNKNSQLIDSIIIYFKSEWLDKNRDWYEGSAVGYPSTNNGLEATNSVIKGSFTFRERLPMGELLSMFEIKLIPYWTSQRNPEVLNADSKLFSVVPKKTDEVWRLGYQWANSNVKVLSTSNEPKVFYIPSTSFLTRGNVFSQNSVTTYLEKCENAANFEEFSINMSNMYNLSISNSNIDKMSCDCPSFLKYYVCKHCVGVAIRLRLLIVPDKYKGTEISRKRKRGRPSTTRAALVFQ